ncbi:hypothetical protein SteCoe_432 [Stentor coeruleus]|uniref:Uncharacterized protein n=1 Tax=Stentor coeruleus TaxID=5963 RepID=A0A1R2D4A9_9CILI|nr:hypothetical protein SteCoe_432 [Stentor coeruleus]
MLLKSEILVLNWNKKALELKNEGKVRESLILFLKAEEILRTFPSVKLQYLTYNNLACHFEKEKSYNRAISYLAMCTKLKDIDPSCKILNIGVYLNLSAIKSKLNLHEAALNHALKAHALLETIQNSCLKTICYYSVALEYEYLTKIPFALHYYKKAFEISLTFFGPSHEITEKIRFSLRFCKEKPSTTVDSLCILREKTSYSLKRSKRFKTSRNCHKEDNYEKTDTKILNKLINWRAKTRSESPKLNTSKNLRQKFSQLSQENNRSAAITGKLEEKLNFISKELASLNGKLSSIGCRFEGENEEKSLPMKFNNKMNAAVKIQKAFREYLKRQQKKLEKTVKFVESKERDLKVIPFFLMNFDVTRASKRSFTYANNFAIRKVEKKVQTSREGPRNKKKTTKGLLESIIFIQKYIRGFLQRQKYKKLQKAQKH